MVNCTGFEPVTSWLKVKCSTYWANSSYFGANSEDRTRNIQLGRLALYHLSYARKKRKSLYLFLKFNNVNPEIFTSYPYLEIWISKVASFPNLALHHSHFWLLESNQPSLFSGEIKIQKKYILYSAISPLSAHYCWCDYAFWCFLPDLNLRPSACRADTLTNWAKET